MHECTMLEKWIFAHFFYLYFLFYIHPFLEILWHIHFRPTAFCGLEFDTNDFKWREASGVTSCSWK